MYSAAAMEGLFADEQMNRMFMDFATATDGIYVAKQMTMEGNRS